MSGSSSGTVPSEHSRSSGDQQTAPSPRALVFGEALWDLLPSGPVLGGAPLNFAYRLGSLGVPTQFVSQVGNDELGDTTLARMRALNMDLSLVSRSDTLPTATVSVLVDENGNPSYTIVRDVAYDAIPWSQALGEAAASADILCFGTLAQRDERSRRTLRQVVGAFGGATVLVDVNLRPDCWTEETVRWSLERATIGKINEEELVVLAGMYGVPASEAPEMGVQLRRAAGLRTLVVTLGANGALAVNENGIPIIVPGYKVSVTDACGSGDAFAAMFIASLEEGRSLRESVVRANTLGALVATQAGATQPIGSGDVDNLISGDGG